jgi:lauroyl/myristoyl acyltransferase
LNPRGPALVFDGLEAAGVVLARCGAPRTAIGLVANVGRWRQTASRRWPSAAEVAELFGLAESRSVRLARSIAASEARNRLCAKLLGRGGAETLRAAVGWEDPEQARRLRGPALLLTAHIGAVHTLGIALDALPGQHLVVRWGRIRSTGGGPRTAVARTAGGLERRSEALVRALRALRAGEIVLAAADGVVGRKLEVVCLERRLEFGAGSFELARRTGAPLVPLTARWRGNVARVRLHAPISAPGAEAAHAAQATALWLQRYLTAHPREVTLGLLRRLLGVS